MKRSKEKVTVKWSKTEKDWISKYPEWENRNARITGNAFFGMIQDFDKYISKNSENNPSGYKNLRDYLSKGGFDPDTFTISVNAKNKDELDPNK